MRFVGVCPARRLFTIFQLCQRPAFLQSDFEVHSKTIGGKIMSERKEFVINVNGQLVAVREEVYLVYYRSKRRERYFEWDIKTESPVRDCTGNVVGYRPSREDSLDRLLATGIDFVDGTVDVESEAIDAVMAEHLFVALEMLPVDDRELIDALFYSDGGKGMTEFEYAKSLGISQQAVYKRKLRAFAQIRKMLNSKSFGC
jgi:DNA-directed RNA polymerase specialized sigma24 family protein